MIASTASPIVAVELSLTLSTEKRPVRISQRPSKIIPMLLPARFAIVCSSEIYLSMISAELSTVTFLRGSGTWIEVSTELV